MELWKSLFSSTCVGLVSAIFLPQDRVWIGFDDQLSDGNYAWTDGSPMTYFNLQGSYPFASKNCGTLLVINFAWEEYYCVGLLWSICYKDISNSTLPPIIPRSPPLSTSMMEVTTIQTGVTTTEGITTQKALTTASRDLITTQEILTTTNQNLMTTFHVASTTGQEKRTTTEKDSTTTLKKLTTSNGGISTTEKDFITTILSTNRIFSTGQQNHATSLDSLTTEGRTSIDETTPYVTTESLSVPESSTSDKIYTEQTISVSDVPVTSLSTTQIFSTGQQNHATSQDSLTTDGRTSTEKTTPYITTESLSVPESSTSDKIYTEQTISVSDVPATSLSTTQIFSTGQQNHATSQDSLTTDGRTSTEKTTPYITTESLSVPESSTSDKIYTEQSISVSDVPVTSLYACVCNCDKAAFNMTMEELALRIQELENTLALKKTSVSSYKRTKISAYDERTSSKSIGYIGVAVLVIVFGSIVLMDVHTKVFQVKIRHNTTKPEETIQIGTTSR